MKYELLTLDGKKILDRLSQCGGSDDRSVLCDRDITLLTDEYDASALLYQLQEQLKLSCPQQDSRSACKYSLLYLDFSTAFPMEDRAGFDRLFEEGFVPVFPHQKVAPRRFVPFLSSQSQSKKQIFAFVREDLFEPMQKRLNLDIPFEKERENKNLAYLAKLYAYRALYTSSAVSVLHGGDAAAASFFHEDNIIILPDHKHSPKTPVTVFTAEQEKPPVGNANEVMLRPKTCQRTVPIDCFDGVGLLSPHGRDIINERLPGQMRGNSFQVRMPFFKGVLHTVDFHQFLRDSGVTAEHAYVIDVFGERRDLFRANIIVTPSVFKLKGLLPKGSTDVMRYYFDKIKEYDHGLYVVQTEASIHSTQYVRLNSQLLSTLDLSAEELDGLVQDHVRQADDFRAENLVDPAMRKRLFAIADQNDWMELLLKEPRFIHDRHIQRMIRDYRISRYKDIALGRLRVAGESRFLSGDLYYFLICLLRSVAKEQPHLTEKCTQLAKRRIKYGAVYIPQAAVDTNRVALLRNPHLSRNEDVGTVIAKGGFYHYYDKYLGHLNGVIFVGDLSYIPAAMGGADFDGDHINVVYDERIINACYKSGYVELRNQSSAVPFIQIPPLQGMEAIAPYRYVSAQAVYNTFSNRIGKISNAAMKIAAVEYDTRLPQPAFSAALCTILTGSEIDATKKGVRPHIDHVTKFTGKGNTAQEELVKEVSRYIAAKDVLRSWRGRVPHTKWDGDCLCIEEKDLPLQQLAANREHTAITQLLYRWAEACLSLKEENEQPPREDALQVLSSIFGTENTKAKETSLILRSYEKTRKEYARVQNKRQQLDKTQKSNEAKACIRLKEQYDNIYMPTDGDIACWDKFSQLQEGILDLTDTFSVEEFTILSARLFSEARDTFDPPVFWPYVHASQSVQTMPLYRRIMQLPYAELLNNFDCEGYRLLYYALENAILFASSPKAEAPAMEDDSYSAFYRDHAKEALSATAFERKLAGITRGELQAVYQTTAHLSHPDTSSMIRQLYPPRTAEEQSVFWKIFTVREVLNALGGDDDAQ